MWIKFRSDEELEWLGFWAKYSFIPDPDFTYLGDILNPNPNCQFELSGADRIVRSSQVGEEEKTKPGQAVDCIWMIKATPKAKLTWKVDQGTSLVVQWLRIHLLMQGTWVRALVGEDLTCHRATKPMHHNCWACTLEPASHNYWAPVPQLLKPACLEPVLCNKRSHHNEKPVHHNEE